MMPQAIKVTDRDGNSCEYVASIRDDASACSGEFRRRAGHAAAWSCLGSREGEHGEGDEDHRRCDGQHKPSAAIAIDGNSLGRERGSIVAGWSCLPGTEATVSRSHQKGRAKTLQASQRHALLSKIESSTRRTKAELKRARPFFSA
jgi:hypothetical protein